MLNKFSILRLFIQAPLVVYN